MVRAHGLTRGVVRRITFAYSARVADDRVVTDVEDLATARALITTLRDELTKAQRENASLRHQLDVLCQRLFGKKSERVGGEFPVLTSQDARTN
jgi:hypothetical protein